MAGKTLLLIEDDTVLSEALGESFCYEGYAVDIAPDAQKERGLLKREAILTSNLNPKWNAITLTNDL